MINLTKPAVCAKLLLACSRPAAAVTDAVLLALQGNDQVLGHADVLQKSFEEPCELTTAVRNEFETNEEAFEAEIHGAVMSTCEERLLQLLKMPYHDVGRA